MCFIISKEKKIIIKGAREHNLKNINVSIPRDKLTIITGLSGSGKSSLAFDTIYAEGQRRYMESLSSYARQFLGQFKKPDVDSIEGLSPAISIDQKTTNDNPRSTVGTVTEIYDYLRLLWSKIGIVHCPVCGRKISSQSIDQIVDRIMTLPKKTKIQILAPIIVGKKGEHLKELEDLRKSGYVRIRIDGVICYLGESIKIEKNKSHNIEVVVDRLVVNEDIRTRLSDSCEISLKLSDGSIIINVIDGKDLEFNQNYACVEHGISIGKLEPRMFSFNTHFGACKKCDGLGFCTEIDIDLLIPNKSLSVSEGAINTFGWSSIDSVSFHNFPKKILKMLDKPIKKLTKRELKFLLYGDNFFEGVVSNLRRRFLETKSSFTRDHISSLIKQASCDACKGKRLSSESLAITVGKLSISEFCELSITKNLEFMKEINLNDSEKIIAKEILKEVKSRLEFLKNAGLSYLTLSRSSGTLSGGESQRIRLASSIGSLLMGVTYILDEPSIGLHQSDNQKLIKILKQLRNIGNTVIVVEHDDEIMHEADYIVDIGPRAGKHGGKLVFQGKINEIKKCRNSVTGKFLSGEYEIKIPEKRRKGSGKFLEILGAKENNLKEVDLKIPLGTFTCITGVSGSGKSSLINETLYKFLAKKLNRAKTTFGKFKKIKGINNLDKIIDISQSPIGRTPRSNPATYTGVFTEIRELFSKTNAAKVRGFTSSRFSFNINGGRCEACFGDGIKKIEMMFLPNVFVPCEICEGKRYNKETLKIKYREKNISDVLDMTCEEALEFFKNHPKIFRKIKTLCDVGLSYIKLGQSSTTLSGGEAQRIKLASELSRVYTGKTIYVLDEPTTGLHNHDIKILISVLQRLVDAKNTVVVIEHNLDFIKTSDYIVDLGPEGGTNGGEIIAVGTPEEISKNNNSLTGKFLSKKVK